MHPQSPVNVVGQCIFPVWLCFSGSFFTMLQLLNQFEPIEKGESETFAIPHWLPTGKYCQSDFYHEVTLCLTLCFGLTTEREHLICKQKPVSQPAKS